MEIRGLPLNRSRFDYSATVPGRAPFLFIALFICLGAVVPLVIIGLTPDPSQPSWAGAWMTAALAALMFSVALGGNKVRLFEMTTWLFFYSFMGLAPLVQLRSGLDPYTTPNVDHSYDWSAFLVIFMTQIGLAVGTWMAKSRRRGTPTPHLRAVSPGRTKAFGLVIAIVALLYVAYIGPAALWGSRDERSSAVAAVIPDEVLRTILFGFVSLGLLVSTLALLQLWRENRRAGIRSSALPAMTSAALLLIIVNPFGSPRFVLMTVLLGLAAALGLFRSLRRFRVLSVAAVAAMVAIFPVLDSFRNSTSADIETVDPLAALSDPDFDSFAQVLNTLWLVDLEGINWGWQFLGVLLFWVPRSFWPDKPVDTGILLAEQKGYGFGNLSAPLPAELYINGGFLFVVVASILLGFLLVTWDESNHRHIAAFGVPTLLGCVLPFYLILILRGSLLQATANLAVIVVSWWIVTSSRHQSVSR